MVACAIYAGARWPEIVLFPQRPSPILQALGWLWLALGIAFWAATLLRFVPRWNRGELITSGPYALCRHPLYALVPIFILPALGFITENRIYFLVALVSLPLALHAGAREEAELLRLYGDPQARSLFEAEIEKYSSEFKPYERISKFALELSELSIESGLLTPTLKIKRAQVLAKFRSVLDALYAESGAGAPAASASYVRELAPAPDQARSRLG